MNGERITEIQQRVMGLVAEVREEIAALQSRVDSIWANTERLTEQARRLDVGTALGEGRTQIEGALREEARGALDGGYAEIERTLGRLTAVDPEELAARERVLRPVLGAAFERPEVLLNLYRERHLLVADRLLIEETASAMIDGLGGTDNYTFRDKWSRVQQEIMLSRGPEELEALSQRSVLDGLASYLDNAERVVVADLTLMDPSFSGNRDEIAIARAMAEAEVNRYETENASVMVA